MSERTIVPGVQDLKYVVVMAFGMEVPIVLTPLQQHCEVVPTAGRTIVAAGFCQIAGTSAGLHVTAYGRSDSLGRESRPEKDAALIKRWLETRGQPPAEPAAIAA